MSTANNQSIRQINTAALRGTREAHQPDEIKPTTKEISMNDATKAEDYATKLEKAVNAARKMPGTSGARGLKKIITDLEGKGPIGELMFSLDQHHCEFRFKLDTHSTANWTVIPEQTGQ